MKSHTAPNRFAQLFQKEKKTGKTKNREKNYGYIIVSARGFFHCTPVFSVKGQNQLFTSIIENPTFFPQCLSLILNERLEGIRFALRCNGKCHHCQYIFGDSFIATLFRLKWYYGVINLDLSQPDFLFFSYTHKKARGEVKRGIFFLRRCKKKKEVTQSCH